MTRTNAFTILCVLVRAFALLLVVRLAGNGFGIAGWLSGSDASAMPFVLVSAVGLAVAALLWLFADVLARAALARPAQQVFESDLPAAEWQRLAFSVVGLWFAFEALLELVYLATRALITGTFDGHGGMRLEPLTGDLVTALVQLGAGIVLLFGARGLVGMLRRFRQFGTTAPDPARVDPAD